MFVPQLVAFKRIHPTGHIYVKYCCHRYKRVSVKIRGQRFSIRFVPQANPTKDERIGVHFEYLPKTDRRLNVTL